MSDVDVMAECRRALAQWDATGPHAGKLECGPLAYEMLLMLGGRESPEAVVMDHGYAFWGVPIVMRPGMEPTAYRLLSTDGELMVAGDVIG